MAEVFLARDRVSGEIVAVKLLSPAFRGSRPHRARMIREAELAMTVSHPRVIKTLDAGVAECGTPFIVIEALVGETLHQYLERNNAMPVELALPMLRQLAEGLRAAHDAGIVHGDVKPKNVFLCGPVGAPESVKLIDFGLACPMTAESNALDGDTVAGTLEYLAPEQVVADTGDSRSDVYAFGVVAFRCLTGELPFDTQQGTQLLVHQLTSPAPPLSWLKPEIPSTLEQLVLTSLRKAKENRYQSMDALLVDLEAIIDGKSSIAGALAVTYPDIYAPKTPLGRRALEVLLHADHAKLSLPSVA
jgi:serine/threonine-protein kinase